MIKTVDHDPAWKKEEDIYPKLPAPIFGLTLVNYSLKKKTRNWSLWPLFCIFSVYSKREDNAAFFEVSTLGVLVTRMTSHAQRWCFALVQENE